MRRHCLWMAVPLALALGGDGSADPARNPEQDYARARAALNAGAFADAEWQFQDLATQDAANADYLLGLGQAKLALHDAATAIAVLEKAQQLAPTYLDILQVLTAAYTANGEVDKAARVRAQAAQLAPDADWTHAVAPLPSATVAAPGVATATIGFESTLTERGDSWFENSAGFAYAWSQRAQIGLRAARSERFDQHDSLFEIHGSVPLGPRLTVGARGLFSPSHRVRVHEAGIIEAAIALDHGWVLDVGGGRSQFRDGPSHQLTAGLENYFDTFRVAYTLTFVQPAHGNWSPVHTWTGSWYYGETSELTFNVSYGKETDASVTGQSATRFDTWGPVCAGAIG